MASTANLASDISAILAPYYHERSLRERDFDIGPFKYAYKAPYEGGQTIHFHKWSKLGLAERLADNTDVSATSAMDATDIICILDTFGGAVSVPTYGDLVRFKKVAKEAFPKLREQAERSAWALSGVGLRTAIHKGSAGMTASGGSFSAASVQYAGGVADFASLDASSKLDEDEILDAVAYLEQQGAPKLPNGGYVAIGNPWVKRDLMGDEDFKTLLSRFNGGAMERNKLMQWAGAFIDSTDMPLREQAGGTENTHVSSGTVFSTYVMGAEAVGYSQVFGAEGSIPKFKVQDITVAGVTMTVGYHVFFVPVVLDANWIRVIKSISATNNVTSL